MSNTCASLKLGEFSPYLATKKSRKLVMSGYLLLIEWIEACKQNDITETPKNGPRQPTQTEINT